MNKNLVLIITIVLLSYCQVIRGQNLAFFQTKFNNGKNSYKAADYAASMQLFLEASTDNIQNPYSKTACFYYALSAFKANKFLEAKAMLFQIQLKYDDWKKDEINYLLGNVYFELKEFDKALAALNKIEDTSVKNDARAMKIFYFNKFKDPTFLKPIYLRNPKEIEVAQILKLKLEDSKLETDKKIISAINELLYSTPSTNDTTITKKDTYKIAVLLPFQLWAISVNNENTDNRFVYDFMQGMKIALDSLDSTQSKIELYLYDCDKDTNKLLRILNLPEMTGMDVIIGPIYQNLTTASLGYANAHKIPTINPFSIVNRMLNPNNYYYFFKPSIETQAKKAANYMALNVTPSKAIILYSKNLRDSLSAKMCKSTLEANRIKVTKFKTVDKNSSIHLHKFFDKSTIDSIGAIFVFNSDQLVATNLITTLAQFNSQVPLFVPSEWMNFESFTYDQYQKHNIHFILPTLNAKNDSIRSEFDSKYLLKFNIVPNEYVYLGYDLMRWLSLNLLENGALDATQISSLGYQAGKFTSGYDFRNNMDNQVVPIVKFEDFLLKEVNR